MRLLLLVAMVALGSSAEIRFPSHIASSMVIQRDQPFNLWGIASPHAAVSTTFRTNRITAMADDKGLFKLSIPAQPASTTPFKIVVSSSADESTTLSDLLFGDVFISSGQSNTFVQESSQYGATLRIAQVALLQDYYNVSEPQTNLSMNIPWARAAPSNVGPMSAIAYFTALEMVKARPGVPIGAIASSWGGTAQEPWMPPDAFKACGEPSTSSPKLVSKQVHNSDPGMYFSSEPGRHPPLELEAGPPSIHSTLWNSMIAPLLSLRVSGFYWYQGESNVGQACFSKCFSAMINSWRQHWKRVPDDTKDIPFIFFQLAPWPTLDAGSLPLQRKAQEAALALPKVGMVVAADRGDSAGAFHPIHPPTKRELSHRAFLATDRLVYGNASSPLNGPRAISAGFDAWDASWGDFHFGTGLNSYVCHAGSGFLCGGIRVKFDQPLVLVSTYGDHNSYANGLVLWDVNMTVYQRAEITGVSGDTLQLNTTWTFGETPPALLRYAYSDYPNMNLYNEFGLPTPPFEIKIA